MITYTQRFAGWWRYRFQRSAALLAGDVIPLGAAMTSEPMTNDQTMTQEPMTREENHGGTEARREAETVKWQPKEQKKTVMQRVAKVVGDVVKRSHHKKKA